MLTGENCSFTNNFVTNKQMAQNRSFVERNFWVQNCTLNSSLWRPCSKPYSCLVSAVGQEHSHRKAMLCVYFTYFRKWCFDVSFLTSISVSTVFWHWKSCFSETFCLLGFEIKQWFSAYQDQVCAWVSFAGSTADWDSLKTFLDHFLKETASRACSMPRQDLFCTLSFAQSRKILS